MISAIVFVSDQVKGRDLDQERERLVRSLVWLVSAVVAGLVREVIVAGPAGMELGEVADHSGCDVVEAGSEAERLAAAITRSRGPRLLIIEAAFQPLDGMIGELDSIGRSLAPEGAARLLAAPSTLWQRLFPDHARIVGLFAPLPRCRELAGRDFRGLSRGLAPRVLFSTRAHPVI